MSEPVPLRTLEDGFSIDCLMVALPVASRLEFAKASIQRFKAQTYLNKRLVIVINGGDDHVGQTLCDYARAQDEGDIEVVYPEGNLSLGALRNISLEHVSADVFCQWDDDDLYHPLRLADQAKVLREGGFEAVYLEDLIQYFPAQQALYWTNWRATSVGGHPGTLMARYSPGLAYPSSGDEAKLGEDTVLAQAFLSRGRVGYLGGAAHLYLYVSHGANSWNDDHHLMLARELSISKALLLRRQPQLTDGLVPYNLPAGTVVRGSNGDAFTL